MEISVRLKAIRGESGPLAPGSNYVELLARLLEDADIDDKGGGTPLRNRLDTVLKASVNGGGGYLHFGGILSGWTDDGFRTEFRDPWGVASNNQCGHFLTAAHPGLDPIGAYNYARSQSSIGTWIETTSGVPTEEGICYRMIVGHEQVAGPENPDEHRGRTILDTVRPQL